MSYRILSFRGGGIRGVLAAAILERVEKARPGTVKRTDLLAGTSTGGIIALGLAAGRSPAELRALYEIHGPSIFRHGFWRRLATAGGALGPRYGNRALRAAVDGLLGTATLPDLGKRVLIPTFDFGGTSTSDWKAKFFHNFPGLDQDCDRAADVAMATSAAPVYFPSWRHYMAAIAQVLDWRHGERQPLDGIRMLTFGTGAVPRRVVGSGLRWGAGRWAFPLLDVIFDGGTGACAFECKQLLGNRHFLLDVLVDGSIGLDDVGSVGRLVELAQTVNLRPVLDWLDTWWR